MTKPDPLAEIDFPPFLNLDRDTWRAFVEVRRRKGQKAPLTEHAARLILRKLTKFEVDGYCPKACLEQSIERGYAGVFETKDKPPPKPVNGKPQVVVLNNFLADLEERKAQLADPETKARADAARRAVMARYRPAGRAG